MLPIGGPAFAMLTCPTLRLKSLSIHWLLMTGNFLMIPTVESDLAACNAQTVKLQQTIQNGLPVETRRDTVLGQLIFCEGCCCGRTDRGFPAWPGDLVKARWKELKLNSTIQLTISGCLGPCDVANVVCLLLPDGSSRWLGGLFETSHYERLIQWVEDCQSTGILQPFPQKLDRYRFERFRE